MARKKANYPLVEGLEITTLAAEGKAMGRWNDVVVFVPLTVPGDVVDVQIRSKRRRFMEGFVVRYVKKSPLRAEAFCEHFGVCGGCKWQNLPYGEQLRFKTDQVRDQLTRIGKIELPEIAPCLGSAETQFYRNKLEFTFADRRWLTREEIESAGDIGDAPAVGFHIPGMFDKVLDIRKCWLQPDPSNGIRMEAKRFCVENGYTFHNARSHEGAGSLVKNHAKDTTYRYESLQSEEWKNTAMQLGINGTSYYFSLANPDINQFQREMYINQTRDFCYSGFDARTMLEVLSGVRYMWCRPETADCARMVITSASTVEH